MVATARFASPRRLLEAAGAAAGRFPEVVACAVVAGGGAMTAIGIEDPDWQPWMRLWCAASLGLPLFTALVLLVERRGWRLGIRCGLGAAVAALLVVLYFQFGRWPEEAWAQRYIHLAATFHLAAAAVPYWGLREPWGFWQYNRTLFFRFLMAGVYAAALCAGSALALGAVDNLLGVDVPELAYGRLVLAGAFGVQPLIFLAGMPQDLGRLEEHREYPAWLKVFSQHVMLPLVAVYAGILWAYMAKILVTGTWPSGWISYLVASLAVAGIFSLLMVHPERLRRAGSWIDRYALGFWVAVAPSAVMVLLAVWQRFQQYGVTERRYLLGLLAVWLAATAVYRAVSRTREIKSIPLSLALLGALSFVGPWSAYAVSERSQLGRIAQILEANDVPPADATEVGAPSSPALEIPFEEWRQMEDAVAYLTDNHGTDVIQAWSGGLRQAAGVGVFGTERGETPGAARIVEQLGVRPGPSALPVDLVPTRPRAPVSARGFDLLVTDWTLGESRVDGDALGFRLSEDGQEMAMRIGVRECRASLERQIALAAAATAPRPEERSRRAAGSAEQRETPAGALVVEFLGGSGQAADAAPGTTPVGRLVLDRLRVELLDGRWRATEWEVGVVLLAVPDEADASAPICG